MRVYSNKWLTEAYNRAKDNERESLIFKLNEGQKREHSFTRLSLQYTQKVRKVRDICSSHWHLLREDASVSKFVSSNPKLVFRRARSLSDPLVHSGISWKPPHNLDRTGMTQCGSCEYCPYMVEGDTLQLTMGRLWKCKQKANCNTMRVVYVILCSCNSFYICKTIRPVHKRFQEHRDPSCLKCWVLEVVPQVSRGGNFDQLVLQHEARWIWELEATKTPGINDSLSFVPFLKDT